ncbi:MAG: hypothetical protein JO142_05700 [Burkholderiales bacterium]|nr:hypothetical protein [Burkholderiales bacterium]
MIDALSSSFSTGISSPDAALGAVDAQIASYEVKLADWVNCPSCKTPEGKAKIADLQTKIAGLKQQKQTIEQRRLSKQAQTPAIASAGAVQGDALQTQPTHLPHHLGSLGNRLDIFA